MTKQHTVKRGNNLRAIPWALAILAWVSVCYVGANIATVLGLNAAKQFLSFTPAEAVETTLLLAVGWTLTFAFVFFSSRWVLKLPVSAKLLGVQRTMSWTDIGLGLVGFVPYLLLAVAFTAAVSQLIPGFDIAQEQDTGFNAIFSRVDMVLAFLALVVVAPIVEELLFRGYLYSALRERRVPVWLTWLLVSALFGLAHGQWNVGLNVFALSLVMCAFRHYTGSIWAGVILHMAKNGIAFYFLYVADGILGL